MATSALWQSTDQSSAHAATGAGSRSRVRAFRVTSDTFAELRVAAAVIHSTLGPPQVCHTTALRPAHQPPHQRIVGRNLSVAVYGCPRRIRSRRARCAPDRSPASSATSRSAARGGRGAVMWRSHRAFGGTATARPGCKSRKPRYHSYDLSPSLTRRRSRSTGPPPTCPAARETRLAPDAHADVLLERQRQPGSETTCGDHLAAHTLGDQVLVRAGGCRGTSIPPLSSRCTASRRR
jgi:hypothetical protein